MIQSLSINPRPHGCEKLSGQERYRVRKRLKKGKEKVLDWNQAKKDLRDSIK
jgi:hypothetical protein